MKKNDLSLKNRKWKEFVIENIFKVDKGIYLHSKNKIKGNIPFVSAKSVENGVSSFIGNSKLFNGNAITIEKIKLTAFYQPYAFYCSHDVTVIESNFLNKYNAQFICHIINRNGIKYSYGRQSQMNIVKRDIIYLPINSKDEPDFIFMENFIKQKEQIKLNKYNNYVMKRFNFLKKNKSVVPLKEKEWKDFKLQDFFDTNKGNQNKMSDLLKGNTPLISAKNNNNGLKDFVSPNNKESYPKMSLTLNNDGDGGVGISYYQPFDYLLDSHVTSLKPKNNLSRLILLFISRCITKQRNKFGHGYSLTNNRLTSFKILLPINKEGNPDYVYMETYMKNLELKKLKEYLNFLN